MSRSYITLICTLRLTFRLYEPGDQVVDIIVPVIYSQTDNTTTPKKIHLTDSNPSSTAQWLNPYEILVRV